MVENKKEPENLDEYIYELYGVKNIQTEQKQDKDQKPENPRLTTTSC